MDTAGYILGIVCGLLLYALFAKGLVIAVGPYVRSGDRNFQIALAILIAITIVKLALLRVFPGEPNDLAQFELWGQALARFGPTHIYEPRFHCIYTPAYFYALWPAYALAPDRPEWPRMFVEGITVLADFFLGLAAYAAVRRIADVRFALPTILLLALNPALIYTSTVWGQNDSAIAFPALLSIVMVLDSQYVLAWAIAIVAAMIKAQGLILLPILAWWTLINGDLKDWAKSAGAALATALVVLAPFQLGHPWHFLIDAYGTSLGLFPWPSVNAFNLMLVLVGNTTVLDTDKLIGPISYSMIGESLFAATLVIAAWISFRRPTAWVCLFAVFLVYFGMFLFVPRMHERYLYYAVALLAPLVFTSKTMMALYVTLSVTSFIDVAYVFFNLVQIGGLVEGHMFLSFGSREIVAIVNIAAFAVAVGYGIAVAWRRPADLNRSLLVTPGNGG